MTGATVVESSNPLFNKIIRRSLLDLQMLRSRLDGLHYFAAGIPWFNTLFGRDACITAIQTMPFGHSVASQTLQLLARYQATTLDVFRDAEPGKILHEYRTGELARSGLIPQSPAYYGTVDATLLFLILMAEYVNWSGDLELARKLRPNVDAALGWIDNYADHDGDGYLDYAGEYRNGLINQGWKDAGNSIPNADGSQVKPPVAVCEVQAYLYRAWRQTAALLRTLGEGPHALALEKRAADLRERFERDFWSEELGCYVLALQRGGQPAAVVSSNAGQVLWGGIAKQERARRVVERLMQPDMFSGWGVRTLSNGEKTYNPISYHLGSVWPHDNALIAAGFERYGEDVAALRLFSGLFDAASNLRDYRLPELYSGYERREGEHHPVGFPVACSPQAWAAGALPHMLWTVLGLRANAPERRLRIVRPVLPRWLDWLELRRIRVGDACLDLRFERAGSGTPVTVDILGKVGEVDIERTEESGEPGLFT
jgi:glycogen debranching enzyme